MINNFKNDNIYFVLDGKMSYSLKNFEIFGEINNVLGEKYSTYVSSFGTTKYYYPAPERNFMFGVDLKF